MSQENNLLVATTLILSTIFSTVYLLNILTYIYCPPIQTGITQNLKLKSSFIYCKLKYAGGVQGSGSTLVLDFAIDGRDRSAR